MAEVKTNGQYVRTEWNVGDIIGAEDLNHLEKRAAYNIIAQDEEPTDTQTVTIDDNTTFTQEEVKTHNQIWINTTVDTLENHQVPEIDDENVSETDTWSSQHMVETFARNDVKNDDASSPITAFTETQKDNIAYNSGTVRDKYLAPLFSASSSYNVGDYVMYNNKLYRCITAIETGGSWSTYSSRFTEVSMGDEVSGLKSDLRNSIATFSYNKQLFNFVYGTWTSAGVKSDNTMRVRIDELVPINNIKVLRTTDDFTYIYCGCWDKNKNYLGTIGNSTWRKEYIVNNFLEGTAYVNIAFCYTNTSGTQINIPSIEFIRNAFQIVTTEDFLKKEAEFDALIHNNKGTVIVRDKKIHGNALINTTTSGENYTDYGNARGNGGSVDAFLGDYVRIPKSKITIVAPVTNLWCAGYDENLNFMGIVNEAISANTTSSPAISVKVNVFDNSVNQYSYIRCRYGITGGGTDAIMQKTAIFWHQDSTSKNLVDKIHWGNYYFNRSDDDIGTITQTTSTKIAMEKLLYTEKALRIEIAYPYQAGFIAATAQDGDNLWEDFYVNGWGRQANEDNQLFGQVCTVEAGTYYYIWIGPSNGTGTNIDLKDYYDNLNNIIKITELEHDDWTYGIFEGNLRARGFEQNAGLGCAYKYYAYTDMKISSKFGNNAFRFSARLYNSNTPGEAFVGQLSASSEPKYIPKGYWFQFTGRKVPPEDNTSLIVPWESEAERQRYWESIVVEPWGIVELNNPVIMREKLSNLYRSNNPGSANNLANTVTFLHFSDLHNREKILRRIVDFREYYSNYITDAIHTGDIRGSINSTNYFATVDGAENILQCLGNHDIWNGDDSGGWAGWHYWDDATAYAEYIQPYVSNWDVTISGQVCYYYKDYTSQNLRLIVQDYTHEDTTQLNWFKNTLTGALTNNYDVVVATHAPMLKENENATMLDSSWSSITYPYTYRGTPFTSQLGADFIDAIDDFVEDGGTIACVLCGHKHIDKFSTFHDILQCNVTTAGDISVTRQFDVRTENEKSYDAFNIVGIDTFRKYVRVVRVGLEYTNDGGHLDNFCWDYVNHKIIHTS